MSDHYLAEGVSPAATPGITSLNEAAHRIQYRVALAVMVVPTLGAIEAVRLLAQHRLGYGDLVIFAAMYFVHMGGITMGFHRLLAHRGYRAYKWFETALVIMGSCAGQGPVLYWVSTHRAHHAYSDTPGDPHTPQLYGSGLAGRLKGLWYAHMPWMLSQRVASSSHFARDLLRERNLLRLQQTYFVWLGLGLVVPAVAGAFVHHSLVGLWYGFICGGLARMFLANHAAWCVGSVCHMFGSRPFRTADSSGNNWWVAILTFGEGLQNNHHAFPTSYRHAVYWWEPDLSAWCLAILAKLGVVFDLRYPTRAMIGEVRIRKAAQFNTNDPSTT